LLLYFCVAIGSNYRRGQSDFNSGEGRERREIEVFLFRLIQEKGKDDCQMSSCLIERENIREFFFIHVVIVNMKDKINIW